MRLHSLVSLLTECLDVLRAREAERSKSSCCDSGRSIELDLQAVPLALTVVLSMVLEETYTCDN